MYAASQTRQFHQVFNVAAQTFRVKSDFYEIVRSLKIAKFRSQKNFFL